MCSSVRRIRCARTAKSGTQQINKLVSELEMWRSAVAMHIDNNEQASRTLHEMGFEILCEADLAS